MLNLALVKTFVALAETGSFGRAAASLGMAQPTVSQHIKRLETSLGQVLIQRSHAECRPTPQGLRILPFARALLASADRLTAAASSDHMLIGCSGNIASYFIADDLRPFVETEQQGVRWDIAPATNPETAVALADGRIDVAAMEWPDHRPEFTTLPWRREEMIVIVPPESPLAARPSIDVETLLELELIGGEPGSGTGSVLRDALGSDADRLRISHTMYSTEAVKSAVAAGLGHSIVLKRAVEDELSNRRLVGLAVTGAKLEKQFCVSILKGTPEDALPAKLAAFLSTLGQAQATLR